MKKLTNWKCFLRLSVAVALAVAIWTPLHSQSVKPGEGKMMVNDKMMERCQGMQKLKQKLNEDTKAQDVELTEQVALMNSSADDKKLRQIAAVVTQMAEQRAVMNARTVKMHDEMIKHMAQHMQMGAESVSHCPMMKGEGHIDENMARVPKAHHDPVK
jgi:hypothetical protein